MLVVVTVIALSTGMWIKNRLLGSWKLFGVELSKNLREYLLYGPGVSIKIIISVFDF